MKGRTMSKSKEKSNTEPHCDDRRRCFARINGRCLVLVSTYEDGECPFCKEEKDARVKYKAARRTPKVELWR